MNVEWRRDAQEATTLKVRPVDIDGGVIIFVNTGLTGITFVVPGEQAKEFARQIIATVARESV
jgi:hypothetical protein